MSIYVRECTACGRISINRDENGWSGWSYCETTKQNAKHSDAKTKHVEECPVCVHHKEQLPILLAKHAKE